MTSSIAARGESLAPLMRVAGFRYVFLGIENILDEDLEFLRASSKNAARKGGRQIGNATLDAIEILHRHGMYVVGGLIVGNPGDTRESIEANLEFARRYVDWPYIQHPTPYPGTPMTQDFRERNLVVNENVNEYRRDHRRRPQRAPRGGRNRIHALARGAMDEGPALLARPAPRPVVRPATRRRDVRAHLPRQLVAIVPRPRKRSRRLRALPGAPTGRARLSITPK